MEREFEELNDEFKAIAIDTAHFRNEIADLQQSSFLLGEKKELLLVIEGGVVRLSTPNNFVTLTASQWMKLTLSLLTFFSCSPVLCWHFSVIFANFRNFCKCQFHRV